MAGALQERLQQLYAPLARELGMDFRVTVSSDLNFVQIRGGGANFLVGLRAKKRTQLGETYMAVAQRFLSPLAAGKEPLFTKVDLNAGQGIVTGEYCGLAVSARIGAPPSGTTTLESGGWVEISGMVFRR